MNFRNQNIRMSVTNVLIACFVLVYLVQMIFGVRSVNMDFGMNGTMVMEMGQYYRLITANFLHGSLLHLLLNCQFIYIIGNTVESILGRWRYIVLVIVTMLASSGVVLVSDIINYPGSITIGASGYGYGLVGALCSFAVIYPGRYYKDLVQSLLQNILFSSVVFLVLGSSVSWAGHIGGFLGGLATVAVLNMFFKRPQW